jgi:hypothetical protein
MYGPAGGGGGGGGGGGRPYHHKPLNAGSQKPALADLPMHIIPMFDPTSILEYRKPLVKPAVKPYTGQLTMSYTCHAINAMLRYGSLSMKTRLSCRFIYLYHDDCMDR